MAINRFTCPSPSPGQLTHAQRCWLLYGFDPKWSGAFASEAHYRETWARNREELMREYAPCRRPIAWWRIEAPFPYPGFDNEKLALYAAGLLNEDEVCELRRDVGPSAPAPATELAEPLDADERVPNIRHPGASSAA